MEKLNIRFKWKLSTSLIIIIIIILGLLFTNNDFLDSIKVEDIGLIDVIEPFDTHDSYFIANREHKIIIIH